MSNNKIAIPLPDEIRDKHPHGQWVFDTPGLVLNFLSDVDEETGLPDVAPMVKQLEEFLASDAETMPFESPHTAGLNYLHRHAAARIIATCPAWSSRVWPRMKQGEKRDVQLVDAGNGLPLIRKLN